MNPINFHQQLGLLGLDNLEFSADVAEWLAQHRPDVKTIGDLASLELSDDDADPPKGNEIPTDLADEIFWALGYFTWTRLKGQGG